MAKRKRVKYRDAVTNPFKELAIGLSSRDENIEDIWEEEPVPIKTFIESTQFLNEKWNGRIGCRPKILKILQDLSQSHVREAILILGKGCVAGDSLITLADGSICRIDKLYKKYGGKKLFEIINIDEETNGTLISKVAVKYSGEKELYKIKTEDGRELKLTFNHKLVTFWGKKELNELKVDDSIAVYKDQSIIEGGCNLTKEEARFLGYMIGDGFTANINLIPEDISKYIRNKLKSLKTGKSAKPAVNTLTGKGKRINIENLNNIAEKYFNDKRDFVNGNIQYVKIKSIEKLDNKYDVYDITVDKNGNENLANYCANGIVSGNSGKDYLSAILHLYGIYKCLCLASPQTYYGLSENSKIYFVNTARNDTQAKKVFFEEFKGLLSNCPWFDSKYDEPGTSSVNFEKRIEAISVNSQAFGWLGFHTLQWVGDELAFFLTNDKDEESESRAEECWQAAFGSCKTRGIFKNHYKMIGITSPRYDDDFVMKKKRELDGREDGYTAQGATWDIHPGLTKEDFKYQLQIDYRRTMRDFGAQPMGVIESFWADPDWVENNVCDICRQCEIYQNRETINDDYACYDYDDCKANAYKGNGQWHEWFKPDPDKSYFIHFDLSTKKDRVGFSLGHTVGEIKVELDALELQDKAEKQGLNKRDLDDDDIYEEKALIKIDAIGFIAPISKRDSNLIKNDEIYYSGILKYIVFGLRDRGCSIEVITTDQFQSHHFRQSIEDAGIDAELISLDRNDSLPVQAKIALVENRVEYPYDKLLCGEARHLKYIRSKKVDHARGRCFTGDTMFSLLDGREISFIDAIEEFGDNSFWVYSFDLDNMKIVAGKARNLGITRKDTKVVKVYLDNDQIIECSYDHKFLLRNGEFCEAQNLKIDSRLMPLYRGQNKITKNGKGMYQTFRDICQGNKLVYTHRRVAECIYGDYSGKKMVVHHKDFNSFNNDPNNLELMHYNEHREYHEKLRKDINVEQILEMIFNGAVMLELMEYFNCSDELIRGRLKELGYKGILDAREKLCPVNHKVIKVELVENKKDTYCIEVAKYENFALSTGVFVSNSKDLWDGFAGTITNCENFGDEQIGWIDLENDYDED